MKNIAFWHVYLNEDVGSWAGIVMEQLGVMERSNLIAHLDELRIVCVKRDWNEARLFTGIVGDAMSNVYIHFKDNPFATDQDMLTNISSPNAVTEGETLRHMHTYATNHLEDNLLYFHTKGITADLRFLKAGNFAEYKKYYYWRQMLNWGVLERWTTCLNLLDNGNDIVGPNYQTNPHPHYSGGCYWTKGSYVARLPDPTALDWWHSLQARTNDPWLKTAADRFRNEMWITQADGFNAANLTTGIDNPASKFVSTREYC